MEFDVDVLVMFFVGENGLGKLIFFEVIVVVCNVVVIGVYDL